MFTSSRIISLFLLSSFAAVLAQDFIGCGGFIRSDVEIDFSSIRVRLYTKQGSIKEEAECAPNNGYYMIPVYEKGEYVLKVETPSGWGLTPESVSLHIDGSSDPCSRNEDINFQFTGFGLIGKVVSLASETGPKNVQVTLLSANGAVSQSTFTGDGGRYIFANVLPGRYKVNASHPFWEFEKASAEVEVNKVTGDAGSSIVVHGYDVTGSIESDGEPVQGVSFLLYADSDVNNVDIHGCNKMPDTVSSKGRSLLCQVMSDEHGTFRIDSVPVGRYHVVPIYKGQLTSFEVFPAEETFTVSHQSFKFPKSFTVTGFTVRGSVRTGAKAQGVPGAKVSVDGNHVATTDESGSYELAGMKSGFYSIGAVAAHMHFPTVKHKVTPKTPIVPDLLADRFDICGQIIITDAAAGMALRTLRSYPETDSSKVSIISADKDGTFCVSSAVGVRHVIEPTVSEAERRAGLKLAPERRIETVVDRPVTGILFSQFLAVVKGTVTCLENCIATKVILRSLDKADTLKSAELLVEGGTAASFNFENITPGRYKVNLLLDAWCWEPGHVDLSVEKNLETVQFIHGGYKLNVNSSHDVVAKYEGDESNPNVTGVLNLHRGINHICLPTKGAYTLTPLSASCHRFEQEHYHCDTKDAPSFINMKALQHRIDGEVVLDAPATDVMVTIDGADSHRETVGPLSAVSSAGDVFIVRFDFFGREDRKLRVSAASAEMLFSPASVEAIVNAESCPAAFVRLEGRQGMFFLGKVTPAVAEVTVRVRANDGTVVASAPTNSDGIYSIGPLVKSSDYALQAEKDGYVLSVAEPASGSSSTDHNFLAHKLAEVAVEVVDSAGQPLSGVLLSLTGGSAYKSNNLTHETGRFSFLGLAPGRYFIRPLLKEYQFQPSSQFVDVSEGELIPVRLTGFRVAFSCYGKLTSVHGEAESSVTLEAIGRDDCSKYAEEARTESDGTFRIRGLKPSCQYKLMLKNATSDNRIERIVPEGQIIEVKDADVNLGLLLAFHPVMHTDVCVFVRAKEEYLSSIKLKLYRADSRDETLLHSVTPGQSSVSFFTPILKNGQRHVVRLESTLSQSLFDYNLTEAEFIADAASKHLSLDFLPKIRPPQQDFSSGGSFAALVLVIVAFVLLYNCQQIIPIGQSLLEFLAEGRQRFRGTTQQKVGRAASGSQLAAASAGGASDSSSDLIGDLDLLTGRKDRKAKPRRA